MPQVDSTDRIVEAAPAASVASADAVPGHGQLRRRLIVTGLLAAFVLSLLLAVPALRPVLREAADFDPGWLVLAIAFELGSCLGFVILFRHFFDRVPAGEARLLAWTSMATGVLLPGGGAGGLAIGGWLMRMMGVPTDWIVRRSSAIFFFTTGINALAIIVPGALLLAGVGGPDDFLRAALPVIVVTPATVAVAALPLLARPGRPLARNRWVAGIVRGIGDAEVSLRRPHWRLVGAVVYLLSDIAVLWAAFAALGHAPPLSALVIAYTIGYAANALPIPGGIGVLDAGLTGALVLYGVSPVHAAAAVLVYHAIAFWVPSAGGMLAYGRLSLRLSSGLIGADTNADADALPQDCQGVRSRSRSRSRGRWHPVRRPRSQRSR
jgi:uncharacterized membrane protein YbhN (UPF0104 family)